MIQDIIISIKPCFSNEIYSGKKSVELRKHVGRSFINNSKMYIYSSSPNQEISGHAFIKSVQILPVLEIRRKYLTEACISPDTFDRYYSGHQKGVLIWLKGVVKYQNPITLAQLKSNGFTAPQSFCYVTGEVKELLESTL
ncbi:hypothetical protein [Nitrosomonas communis]|uniref:Predicted transcriptional regulator, contains an HTH and PUA-like domains n=1 Tax=Nitrosomonas communis TaxID=44574 RepID=A0A1I4S3D1_9PROT|nr:hypothetical protein [Nitrosomonas communis]SFM58763.1 Predicted transcriptional regulator, contains an HTH and PUA-like domains [Nitrosomonas communis]